MSISSEELNYLIWRYLQECGHEVSALALQEETRCGEFEERFKEHIPIGTLVNLVQKGILYTESELLLRYDGEVAPLDSDHYKKDFNLVQALEVDKQRFPELVARGRFTLEHEEDEIGKSGDNEEIEEKNSEEICVKTLKCVQTLPSGFVSQWNPKDSLTFAWGQKNSEAAVVKCSIEESGVWKILEKTVLGHASSEGKSSEITCVEWSPSGESLLTASEDGEVRLWSKHGRLQNVLNYHKAPVVCVKWNIDQTHALTCDANNVTIVWNVLSGTAVQHFSFKKAGAVEPLGIDITWIDQDKFALPGLQGSILIFNLGINKPVGKLLGHSKTLTTLIYNESNKLLLSASDDLTIRIWRGSNINPSHVFYGHSQSITSVQWIDDDTIISTSMDGSTCVWSLRLNDIVASINSSGLPNLVGVLSPDKYKFAVGTIHGEVIIYDIQTLKEKMIHEDQRRLKTLCKPLSIPILGSHQSSSQDSYIAHICWNNASDELSVSYSLDKISILSMR